MRLPLAATLTLAITLPVLGNPGIRFVHDDYALALKQAKSAKKPLFVEAWAPW